MSETRRHCSLLPSQCTRPEKRQGWWFPVCAGLSCSFSEVCKRPHRRLPDIHRTNIWCNQESSRTWHCRDPPSNWENARNRLGGVTRRTRACTWTVWSTCCLPTSSTSSFLPGNLQLRLKAVYVCMFVFVCRIFRSMAFCRNRCNLACSYRRGSTRN